MNRQFVALLIAGIAACGNVASSAQSKPRLAFEVASVRVLNLNGGFRNAYRMTEGRVDLTRTLGQLMLDAFRHQTSYRLSVPDWLNEVFVEIHATLPAGATLQQVPEMLQTLLADRFGLVTHREMRPTDAYELLVAEGGIKMREVEPLDELTTGISPDPSAPRPPGDFVRETPRGPVRTIQIPTGGAKRITSRTMYERRTLANSGGSIITASRMAMAELVPELEMNVDRPVVDRTGLAGLYQFTLQLPYDALLVRMDAATSALLGRPVFSGGVEPSGSVSVFKELERLGLKLDKKRIPVEMIVIDKIARTPTEN